MSADVVKVVLALEAGVLALSLLLLLGVAAGRALRDRRRAPSVTAARERLGASLEAGTPARPVLAAVPAGCHTALLAELAPSLSGTARGRLAAVAETAGVTARAERACRSRLWGRRIRGVRLLTLVAGGEGLVPAMLADPSPELRAAAATWAADHPRPEVVDSLVRMLTDNAPLCRFNAQDALVRIGRPSVAPLLARLRDPDRAGLEEALEVAVALADTRLLEPALALADDSSPRIRALAASIAGAVGGADAVAALTRMLDDPDSDVRTAAARGLGKLAHFPAGPRLLAALRDRAWSVRREAALALAALGAPGILLLRRGLTDDDRFARDIARQVLDLPDTQLRVVSR